MIQMTLFAKRKHDKDIGNKCMNTRGGSGAEIGINNIGADDPVYKIDNKSQLYSAGSLPQCSLMT